MITDKKKQVSINVKTLKNIIAGSKSSPFIFLENIKFSKKSQKIILTFSDNLMEKGYGPKQVEFFSKELKDLDLSMVAFNKLKAFGIKKVKDIITNAGEIKELPLSKFGRRSREELKNLFKEHKLTIDL